MNDTDTELSLEYGRDDLPWWDGDRAANNLEFLVSWLIDQGHATPELIRDVYSAPWKCDIEWRAATEWVLAEITEGR